jgi:hypothetical protein
VTDVDELVSQLLRSPKFKALKKEIEDTAKRGAQAVIGDRLGRVEKALKEVVDEQPVKGEGALGGKRKIHMFADAGTTLLSFTDEVPTLCAFCGERGDIFTRNWSFVNCKKCRAKGGAS